MRRLRTLFLIALSGSIASLAPRAAWAWSYDRQIQLDWLEIEGAERYEIEWFKDKECSDSEGVDSSATTTWKKALPAGIYCVRVRGIGAGDHPGQWTEPQILEVKPKPPRTVEVIDGKRLEWDKVPYADQYRVELWDLSSGKRVWSKTSSKARSELPTELQSKNLIEQALKRKVQEPELSYEIRVQSEVEGLGLSSPSTQAWSIPIPQSKKPPPKTAAPAAGAAADPAALAQPRGSLGIPPVANAPALPPRPERKLPPQPDPLPIEAEEAVERYFISGEKPLPPSREEWARATSPAQREALKRRSIASARVELVEREDRKRLSDLRLSTGAFAGPFFFINSLPMGEPSQGARNRGGFGVSYRLFVEYNRDRLWGSYFRLDRLSVEDQGIDHVFSGFAGGISFNAPMDSIWESVLSLRAGMEYSESPVSATVDGPDGTLQLLLPLSAVGGDLQLNHRIRLSSRWSWESAAQLRYAPEQSNLKDALDRVSFLGGGLSTGPSFAITRDFGLEAGVGIQLIRARHTDEEDRTGDSAIRSQLRQSGVYLQASYRVTPDGFGGRGPASRLAREGLWEGRVELPYGLRRDTAAQGLESTFAPTQHSSSALGPEIFLRHRLGTSSPWSVAWKGGFVSGSNGFNTAVWLGYQTQPALLLMGASYSGMAADFEGVTIQHRLIGPDLKARWQKRLGAGFLFELGAQAMLPLWVISATTPALPAEMESSGIAIRTRADTALGYELGSNLQLWLGYAYELSRSGLAGTGSDPAALYRSLLHTQEHRLRLGIGFSW